MDIADECAITLTDSCSHQPAIFSAPIFPVLGGIKTLKVSLTKQEKTDEVAIGKEILYGCGTQSDVNQKRAEASALVESMKREAQTL